MATYVAAQSLAPGYPAGSSVALDATCWQFTNACRLASRYFIRVESTDVVYDDLDGMRVMRT